MKYIDERDVLEMLLDEECDEPIKMYDAEGECIEFEQVAIIPIEDDIYAIMHPLDPECLGMSYSDALVFKVEYDENGSSYLVVETDDDIAEQVFEAYYQLLDEAGVE